MGSPQISILKNLLFGPRVIPGKGRLINFGNQEPDIRFVTGRFDERIMAVLASSKDPLTPREIAQKMGSNNGRVSAVLKRMVENDAVFKVEIEGCVTEYAIAEFE